MNDLSLICPVCGALPGAACYRGGAIHAGRIPPREEPRPAAAPTLPPGELLDLLHATAQVLLYLDHPACPLAESEKPRLRKSLYALQQQFCSHIQPIPQSEGDNHGTPVL